jgi:integrase
MVTHAKANGQATGDRTMGRKNGGLDVGGIYQKEKGGNYFFRYQINGERKAISLKTKNRKEALARAKEMMPVVKAPSVEVVAAHVNRARNWAKGGRRLELSHAWEIYAEHPDRARPATELVAQHYASHFRDFVDWAQAQGYTYVHEVNDAVAAAYAEHVRAGPFSVDTHNKRIGRVGRVLRTLSDYGGPDAPDWRNPALLRRRREEIGIQARRLPFTREQEDHILAMLDDPGYRCRDREEFRVLFRLGAFTGQRLKDCALLQWHQVDMVRGRIVVTQYKTGKEVGIPIAPQLLVALDEAQAWKRDAYVLPNVAQRYLGRNPKGVQIGPWNVSKSIMRVIRDSGLETSVRVEGRSRAVTVYGFHSLRHSFASFCIDHNVPKAVAVSILGADSGILDQYYTHVGEAAQEQAIQLISGNGATVKQRYDRAVEFLDGIAEEDKDGKWREMERILRG